MTTAIRSQIAAQGSYGLYRINPSNGVRLGHVIKVWHVERDGKIIGSFLTRREARECARDKPTVSGRFYIEHEN